MRKFLLEKGPYARCVDENINSSTRMMNNLLLSLCPIIIFAWVVYGILPYTLGATNDLYVFFRPLVNVLIGALSSVLFEALYFFFFKGIKNFKTLVDETYHSFGIIPGVIIALLFPSTVPFYYIILSCFIGNIIFKMLFGGLGYNIFNPAGVGYVVIATCFSGVIASCLQEQAALLTPIFNLQNLSVISSSTPLNNLKALASTYGKFLMTYEEACGAYGGLFNLFIGFKNGTMGEVSSLLCIVSCVYLICTKVINWRIPVLYVGTVFGICWIIAIVNGIEGALGGIWFPAFNVCTGGVLFGAVFMATEPVTSPKSVHGKSIFAVALGIFTVLLRLHGMYPEGVLTSILFVCLFTPFIDKFASINRSSFKDKKNILRYAVIIIGFALLIFYTVLKATNVTEDVALFTSEVF